MSLTPWPAAQKTTGFTLIELILTIIIMSFAAVIIIPYLTAVTHHPDPVLREKAIALSQAMMDEILTKRWDENTPNGGGPLETGESPAAAGTICISSPYSCTGNRLYCYICRNPSYTPNTASAALASEAGETRATFDDVDDYNGLNEPDISGDFFDQTGATLPGTWTGFSRSVVVEYIASSSVTIDAVTPLAAGTSTDSKRIVVTVTSPLGETFDLVAVKCNF